MANTVTAKQSSGYAKGGDWDQIIIRKAANGLVITRCYDYRPGAKTQPQDEKPYLATSPEEAHEYIDPCINDKKYYSESAEEKAEKKGKDS